MYRRILVILELGFITIQITECMCSIKIHNLRDYIYHYHNSGFAKTVYMNLIKIYY